MSDNEIRLRQQLGEITQENEKLQRKWVDAEAQYDRYRRRLNEALIFVKKFQNRTLMLNLLSDETEWNKLKAELAELERLLHGYVK